MADMARCGNCGNVFTRYEDSRYTNLCPKCPNPHQLIQRIRVNADAWRCEYCGMEGTAKELRSNDCKHFYPPCTSCGEHPFCAPDCPGVAEILNSDGVYLSGFGPED